MLNKHSLFWVISTVLFVLCLFWIGHLIYTKHTVPPSGSEQIDTPTTSRARPRAPQAVTTPEKTPSTQEVMVTDIQSGAVASVSGAPDLLKFGFNNADQLVETENGSFMVWIEGPALMVNERNEDGTVIRSEELASGNLQLPAITKSGNTIVVGWVEKVGVNQNVMVRTSSNNGRTFDSAYPLGAGEGVSLSASGDNVYAVWHQESSSSSAHIRFASLSDGVWSTPVNVDESTGSALWASVASVDDVVLVSWRDNRDGMFSVWLRRSLDRGLTWEPEQHLETDISGDPDVCVLSDGQVWIGHHGRGVITLLKSDDFGKTFLDGIVIGKGYFPHVNCVESHVAVVWEHTTSGALQSEKENGWAVYDASGNELANDVISDGASITTTALLSADGSHLEILWSQLVTPDSLLGTLRHYIVSISQ